MSEIVTIASNAVLAKLHNPTRAMKLEASRILSYHVAGCEQATSFKKGHWDGRSSFFDFKTGTFPAGFIHFTAASLRRKGYETRHVRKPLPAPLGPVNPVVDSFGFDPIWDYQPEVIERLVKHGQIIAQVATGGGKSRIARLAFARIGRPTLFLTTRGILMYQMKDAIEANMGIPVSVLGDGQFGHSDATGQQFIKKFSVGMVQTLIARLEVITLDSELDKMAAARVAKEHKAVGELVAKLKSMKMSDAEIAKRAAAFDKKLEAIRMKPADMIAIANKKVAAQAAIREQTIRLLGIFELVISEEAHESSGNSYYEILRHCKNAHYRLALTATPFMKEDEEANMRLMACSGPVGIRITEKMLIDRGILAKPYFKIAHLTVKPPKLARSTAWQAAYRLAIVENEERNRQIVTEVSAASTYGLSAMVLIQHKKHGDVLLEAFAAAGLRAEFIQGEDNQAERKQALAQLTKGRIDVLIGSTILDVGVDVPAVGMVILAGGGKAEVALRQRIGRGLRAKKSGPNVAFVVDFDDPYSSYTKDHAAQRLAIIKDTEGFRENIVREFDYEGLGLVRKAA